MRNQLRVLITLTWKDLLITARSPWELLALLVFSSLSAIPVTLSQESSLEQATSIVLLFITIYSSTQSYIKELRLGTLDLYHLYPVTPIIHFTSKIVYTLMLLVTAILVFTLTILILGVGYLEALNILFLSLASSIYLSSAASIASLISTYLRSEVSLLIAITAILSLPVLLSPGKSNTIVLVLLGVAYSLVAVIVAELLEEI